MRSFIEPHQRVIVQIVDMIPNAKFVEAVYDPPAEGVSLYNWWAAWKQHIKDRKVLPGKPTAYGKTLDEAVDALMRITKRSDFDDPD